MTFTRPKDINKHDHLDNNDPDHLKTLEICNEAVHIKPLSLAYAPDRFKVQKMCDDAVHNKLCMMLFVPDHFKTREMFNEIMRTMPETFHHIPEVVL